MDDPVDKQLICSRYHQVLLFTGNEIAVDRKLHCSGSMGLSVHSIHSVSSKHLKAKNTGVNNVLHRCYY